MAMQLVRKKPHRWINPLAAARGGRRRQGYYSSREPLSTGELALAGSVLPGNAAERGLA
jgi:hypothetical protein